MALQGMEAVKDKVKLSALARQLKITRGAIAQWDRIPAERIGDISRYTGIPPQVLRPDLFKGTPSAENAA